MNFQTPYTMTVSGQTGSGKTHFVAKLIKNQKNIHDKPFDKIIISFAMLQPIYLELKKENENVTLVEGYPEDELNAYISQNLNILLVLDDMMLELGNDDRLANLFTKMRHQNVSTIFLTQNFYHNGKHIKTVTRNSQYIVIFENPRDLTMIMTLGRQMFPSKPKFLCGAFQQATAKPYGYLLLDLKPGVDKKLRVREGVMPDEQTYVYLPR